MMVTLKKLAVIAAMSLISAFSVQAAVLVGTATLNNSNDLTVIQDGSTVYQFLDLTPTANMSVSNAVSAYSSQGFRWANGTEVSDLFSAFNVNYVVAPNVTSVLGSNFADTANLASYLGYTTNGQQSLGWFDALTTASMHTYACISNCGNDSFTNNSSDFWPVISVIGVFLVRDSQNNVPEPTSFALVGLALAGLGLGRRKANKA